MVDANVPDIALEPDKTVKKVISHYLKLLRCKESIQGGSLTQEWHQKKKTWLTSIHRKLTYFFTS